MDAGIPIGRLRDAKIVIGGQQSLDAMAQVAERATTTLEFDVFSGKMPATLNRMSTAAAKVPDALVLLDSEVDKSIRKSIEASGAKVVETGAFPAKNHVKAVVANGNDALITTGALAPRTPTRFEVSALFTGEPAQALHHLQRATATGSSEAIEAAATAAAKHGIVLNDANHGVWHLTQSLHGMIDGANERIIIASKRVEDPATISKLKAAKKRGVVVIKTQKTGTLGPLHANMVIADGSAYIGSAHLSKRSLTGAGSSGRLSRELGVVIDDAAQIETLSTALKNNGYFPTAATPMSGRSKLLIAAGGLAALGGIALLSRKLSGGE